MLINCFLYLIRILRWGRNEGLKIVEMPLNFNQGTATTLTTLRLRQSLFDLTVTEISTGNEIPIQSLLKILFRNDVQYQATRLTLSEGIRCTFEREQSVSWSGPPVVL